MDDSRDTGSTHRDTILIIDDESSITLILSSILTKNFAFDIKTVNSYADAQKLIPNTRFIMALVDINLGDGSGYDLIPLLKAHQDPSPTVIMMSAHTAEGERDNAIRNGADDFMSKPFNKNVIINTLKSYLTINKVD